MLYSAKCLYCSRLKSNRRPEPNLWATTIFVFRAGDATRANQRAEEIARKREVSYANRDGDDVEWEFVRVLRVLEVSQSDTCDGVAVYWELTDESWR
ncbi:MAG: DUF4288 domain-containing protein [Candidatus Hydrogenedentes bacterium]|nr:DUF4288 domain-containing protein [Candidatus Hydrogenedentota bacterium]